MVFNALSVPCTQIASAVQGNRRYIKCLYVYNKVDMLSIEEVDEIARRQDSLPVSCSMQLNMDMLLMRMWDMMGLVRVYTKKVRLFRCCLESRPFI